MRNIPQAILDEVIEGSEPVFVIDIEWSSKVKKRYATKEIEGAEPLIMSVSEISNATTLSGGQATSFDVKFNDVAGTLKALFDSHDLHFRPITVYQYFDGMGSGLFKIFEGKVASPINWSEADRTLEISAITKRSNIEVGFSVEEGQFEEIHESLIGQAFPLGFGTPIHVPGLALQVIPTGQITEAFGIVDPTLVMQLNLLTIEWGNKYNYGMAAAQYAAVAYLSGDDAVGDQWNQISIDAQNQANDIQEQIRQLSLVKTQQESYAKKTNYVIGGYRFPQNKKVKVKINEFLFWAVFHGQEGSYVNDAPDNFDQKCRVTLTPIIPPIQQVYDIATGKLVFEKQDFTFIQAGSTVTVVDNYPIDYAVNCIPSDIKGVYAFRSFNGERRLTVVPEDYYEVVSYDWQGWLTPTVIRMKRPLSTVSYYENTKTTRLEDYNTLLSQTNGLRILPHIVNNVDWDDQPYVTYQSSVGPNLVDIIRWLIETYTEYTCDQASFDSVKMSLAEYPANFCIFDRPRVDELIEDLAYQGRSRVWLNGNKYYIKYLPKKEDPVDEIAVDDILQMSISTNATEELVTKYVGTWRTDYVKPENRIIFRYNAGLKKYGIQEGGYNFTAFNARELVERSATFWLIRLSNTWKRVDLTLHLGKLNLEINDTITLTTPHITCDCIVESVEYNAQDYSIRVTLWTPIRLGESEPYDFAWPAGISETVFFPTYNEITSGSAGGFNAGVKGSLPAYGQIEVVYQKPKSKSREQAPGRPRDYGSYYLSDEVAPEFLPSSQPTSQPFNFSALPVFNYNYNTVPGDKVPTDDVDNAVYPGEIVSGAGSDYTVKIWKKGLTGDSNNVEAKQLEIDPSEQIPATTKVHVVMNKDEDGNKEYTIQVPVWLIKE